MAQTLHQTLQVASSTVFVSLIAASFSIPTTALSQPIPDTTLDAESSFVLPVGGGSLILGGAARGGNLFHSFSEFDIANGEFAFFNNPVGIERIFSRVTGGSASNILGTLGVLGNADLFFLNPNGVLFGPNSSLAVGGSFMATTADSFIFQNGQSFNARSPGSEPLLAINTPIGLQYGQQQPGSIQVVDTALSAPKGQSLMLLGGDVLLENSFLAIDPFSSQIQSIENGGKITILSAGEAANVVFNFSDTELINLNLDQLFPKGDIVATNSVISTASDLGGEVYLVARNLHLMEDTFIINGILFSPDSSIAASGDINIQADGSINIDRSSINNSVLISGQSNAGDINVSANSLILANGSSISASSFSEGDAGNISIDVNNDITIDGASSGIFSAISPEAQGNGGLVEIKANSLSITNSGQITAASIGRGFAGDISIDIQDGIFLSSGGVISNVLSTSFLGTNAQGGGGDVSINSRYLVLKDSSAIVLDTAGVGQAGNLFIDVEDQIVANRSFISTSTLPGSIGDGGTIIVQAGSLDLLNGSAILASTSGRGDAGNININVRGTILLATPSFVEIGGLVFASPSTIGTDVVGLGAIGNGGDIFIQAKNLLLNDFGLITTSTLSQGNAGDISLDIDEDIRLSKISSIESIVAAGGVGDGGDIDLQSQRLILEGGSQIQTILSREIGQLPGGVGEAGNIEINAQESVQISGISTTSYLIPTDATLSAARSTAGFSSGVLASTERGTVGSAGDISITTGRMSVSNGGIVNALTTNNNDAGDITVNAQAIFLSSGGQVLTSTRSGGQAGNIKFNVSEQLVISGADSGFAARLARFGEEVVNNQGAQSGIFANTTAGSTGNGGNIFIDPELVLIQDGAGIGVNSLGAGQGGNINLQADRLILDNQAFISAGTASNQGGNITINLSDNLFIRNGSLISTTAGTAQAGGNGGNIDITADFIIGVREENSDIAADAFEGNGGQVTISALDIFGLEFRNERTPFSDITASSELGANGITTFNQLTSVDVRQGLTELPENLVDPTGLIDRSCDVASAPESEFIVTGRGGLPSAPGDQLGYDQFLDDLGPETTQSTATQSSNQPSEAEENDQPNVIQEAQGWIVNATGQVQLVAVAPGELLGGRVGAIATSNCP